MKSHAKLVVIFAMQEEARAFLDSVQAQAVSVPIVSLSRFYTAEVAGQTIGISVAGKSLLHGCDRIGTESAMLLAYQSLQVFDTQHLVSAGTCGAFNAQLNIGDVIHPHLPAVFFDHRIALPEFAGYSEGQYLVKHCAAFINNNDVFAGRVGTGHSLDVSDIDKQHLVRLGIDVKEMELAAIAQLAAEISVKAAAPIEVSAVKIVVNAAGNGAHEEFAVNLEAICARLADKLLVYIELTGA